MAAPPKYGPPPASAIPHRPASPSGPRPLGPASQILLARARAALCELRGETPDAADVATRAESDASLARSSSETQEQARREGHRTLQERAAHRRNAGVGKLASLAGKRLAQVKQELVKSAAVAQLQHKTQLKRNELERKRQEEAREQVLKRSAEEELARQARQAEEQALVREKELKLAEQNKKLHELQPTRASTRKRQKSRKAREAADTGPMLNSDEDDEDEEEQPQEEEEEEAVASGESEEDMEDLEDQDEALKEDERAVVQRIRELLTSAEGDKAMTAEQVRASLGPDFAEFSKKFIQNKLVEIALQMELSKAVQEVVALHPRLSMKEQLAVLEKEREDVYDEKFAKLELKRARGAAGLERKRLVQTKREDDDEEQEMDMGQDVAKPAAPAAEAAATEPAMKRSRVVEDDD